MKNMDLLEHIKKTIKTGLSSIDDGIEGLYLEWLMRIYPEEATTSEKLIELTENGFAYDEFMEWLSIKGIYRWM